jgi:hypothetical protein
MDCRWQFLLWGLVFVLTFEEYRYNRFLFLFDTSAFIILSILCPALLSLGAAILMTAAFSEFKITNGKTPTWVFFFFLFLAVWDVFLVSFVYPHMKLTVEKFSVPVFERDLAENGWSPFLGSGDFVVMGVLILFLNLPWWQSFIAYTLTVLTLIYLPIPWTLDFIPALPFLIFHFCLIYLLNSVASNRQLTFASGRGLRGLYWLSEKRQNLKGDANGEPKTL